MTERIMTDERIKELSKRPFFKMNKKALKLLKQRKCTSCGKDIDDKAFETGNEIYEREYLISGLCHKCQETAFNRNEV